MAREAHQNPVAWKDYLVIGVVWAPIIIVPWIAKWHEFLVPIYIAGRKTVDRDYVSLAISLKVVVSGFLALLVAFITDLLKKHYLVWMACLGIYTGAQIYGMVIYYTGPYEAADLVYWLSSSMFVGTAVLPSIIFSQNPHPNRLWSHLVMAGCELSNSVSGYVLFWVVLDRYRALFTPLRHFQILPWVAITFLVLLIVATRVIRNYSPIGSPRKAHFVASLRAVCWSIKYNRKNLKAVEFAFFASLVLPLCIPIGADQAVFHIDINTDGSINLDTSTDHAHLLGQVIGLIIIETVLFGIRKLNARLSDVLSLGLPLLLYLCVAIIIYLRLVELRPLQKSATKTIEEQIERAQIFAGPIPSKTQSVIEFYNVINGTIEVLSPDFILGGSLSPYSRMGVGLNVTATVTIKVIVQDDDGSGNDDANGTDQAGSGNSTVQAGYKNSSVQAGSGNGAAQAGNENGIEWSQCLCVFSELNRFHSYIIHGNRTHIDIFKIHDHGKVKPNIEPVVVVMNTFMRENDDNDRILVWEDASTREVAFYESFSAFSPNRSIVLAVPVGGVKVTYENLEDLDRSRDPDDRSTNVLITEPFVVYTVLMTLQDGKGYMASYEVMRVHLDHESLEVPKIQHCKYVKTAMAVMGAAYSTLMVAFFHHFWMDGRVRLQATIMAVCMVTHRASRWIVDANIKQLEPEHALGLIFLMSTAIVWHFIVSFIYFYQFEFGYRSDEKDDSKRSTPSPRKHTAPKKSPDRPTKVKFEEPADQVKPIGDL